MNLKNIKLHGRYCLNDNHLYFYNCGSGISFKMDGNGFTIGFDSKPIDGYFYIVVDRDYNNKVKVSTLDHSYNYVFVEPGIHLVDVIKANESNDNVFDLVNFNVHGSLLEFDHSYSCFARVFGDSTIAGFGILSHNGIACVDNCDGVRDFCFRGLYEMDMDIDLFCASGFGLAFSAYTSPKTKGVYDYFDKVAVNQNVVWDDIPCDLLIISLGCNDNSFIQESVDKEERINEFKLKYKALIDSQLKLNSGLRILMVYGTLNEESAYYLYEETYQFLKPFYKNLFIHKFKGDSTAISNHAYVNAHDKMSEELKKVVSKIL